MHTVKAAVILKAFASKAKRRSQERKLAEAQSSGIQQMETI